MTKIEHINIIGGGIAGLTLALGCTKKGIDFDLFEGQNEITYEKVGLGISHNILSILKELGLFSEVQQIGTEINHFHFVDKKTRYLKSFDLKYPPLSVDRKRFHELVYKNCDRERIHLGTEKSAKDFGENQFCVIADGIQSETRRTQYPDLKLRDAGQQLWRGICGINLDKKFENAYHDFVGDNKRFAIIHTGANQYSWYAILENFESEEVSDIRFFLNQEFKTYNPMVREIINGTTEIYSSVLRDIPPKNRKNRPWFFNNRIMIGDAIHATTPNMANGACLAMEDAFLLSELIEKGDVNREIFEKFQKNREKKIDQIVNQSWMFGKMVHQNTRIGNFILKTAIRLMPQKVFDIIYSKVLQETKI